MVVGASDLCRWQDDDGFVKKPTKINSNSLRAPNAEPRFRCLDVSWVLFGKTFGSQIPCLFELIVGGSK